MPFRIVDGHVPLVRCALALRSFSRTDTTQYASISCARIVNDSAETICPSLSTVSDRADVKGYGVWASICDVSSVTRAYGPRQTLVATDPFYTQGILSHFVLILRYGGQVRFQ